MKKKILRGARFLLFFWNFFALLSKNVLWILFSCKWNFWVRQSDSSVCTEWVILFSQNAFFINKTTAHFEKKKNFSEGLAFFHYFCIAIKSVLKAFFSWKIYFWVEQSDGSLCTERVILFSQNAFFINNGAFWKKKKILRGARFLHFFVNFFFVLL